MNESKDHTQPAITARMQATRCLTVNGKEPSGTVDTQKLHEARQRVQPKPKKAGILMSILGLLGLSLLMACSTGIKEIKFIEAHGCGGASGALVMDDDTSHAMATSWCGYALETSDGVVGCAVIEQLMVDGIELGAGAVPPSAPQCYEDGHFGPFRFGALISAIIPAKAIRKHPREPDARSQGGSQSRDPLFIRWSGEGSD